MTYSAKMQEAVRLVELGKRRFDIEESAALTVNERLELCSVIRHHVILEKYGCIPPFERVVRIKKLMNPQCVVAAHPLPDYKLDVTFVDGLRGIVCLQQRVDSDGAGVFKALKDIAVFNAVDIDEVGAVTWPGGIDIAPDAMYAEIRKNGTWILS